MCLVQMPPGIANGYKAYGDKMVILANCATEPHDPERNACALTRSLRKSPMTGR